MGFRNFLINEIEPLECLPSATAAIGYTACVVPLAGIPLAHNLYLTAQVALKLPFANAIFLDTQYAFYAVIKRAILSGKTANPSNLWNLSQISVLHYELCNLIHERIRWVRTYANPPTHRILSRVSNYMT